MKTSPEAKARNEALRKRAGRHTQRWRRISIAVREAASSICHDCGAHVPPGLGGAHSRDGSHDHDDPTAYDWLCSRCHGLYVGTRRRRKLV